MAEKKTVPEILDDMALKILMIEPGDLSVVGELVTLAEQLIGSQDGAGSPALGQMGTVFLDALGKIIMGELDDSAANFERLGKCISQMQEVLRKEGQAGPAEIDSYRAIMQEIGLEVDRQALGGGGPAAPAEAVAPAAVAEVPPVAAGSEAAAMENLPDFLKDTELLSGFIEEAFEHLESIEVNILELEQNPDDKDIINNIFRPFHTIKGVAGFLNLTDINKLAHATENLLDDVRNDKRAMDAAVIDIVLSVGDYLRTMVGNIKEVLQKGPALYKKFEISDYVRRVQAVQEGSSVAPAQESPVPRAVAAPQAPASAPVTPTVTAVAVATASQAAAAGPAERHPGTPAALPAVQKKIGATIKVDIEKLDSLVNAVGELVIMQVMVKQNPLVSAISDPKLTRDLGQLSRITTELQKTAMAMRMVPIRQTFQKMTRLVRDLSQKSGKLVDLVMTGEETEIDRNMVDSIYDPLVHMIRNSVDHGVQPPAEREKLGKPPTGTVNLRAYQKGSAIIIEIEDDGHGLNTEKIRSKGIERGLISADNEISDHEINNLIFLPGFSTADKITDVSGRGVGMDVVKKGVEKLRGKVEVVSTPGVGSQFVIKLPLTLAIIDGIVVRVGEERYIIPTIAIQESIRPQRDQYSTVHGRGETLLIRGHLIPIIRLYEAFGVKSTYTDPCEGIVVVIESELGKRALLVDELLGKQEVVIKSLGGYMKDIKGVGGGTILGDGRVGLILDLAGLVAASDARD
ncbi:MAG: chemotaxis protein CheA [Desulfobacterales bacterium CG2_30_60_27]|nr:MAG: chemotaxis protein CheA [Desulfobacterales bacterium CG2_30_60_27]